ncbi:histone-lysine N-methyltransferase SETMAR [Plakobranchus ocellatus]|uniref:Histone-lysine N-methyltransferase SETMAR n=1 Tax=Plakobranchus ocellatus TaxID=259542 RepID=A0AAV3ZV93_9GAST|nr:histone-lysine N-methyltransferase SETMAR [Plakobranchus ocellatus]
MRSERLENLVTTGMLEGKRSRGKQREKLIEGLADWLKAGKSLEAIEATKDRKTLRLGNSSSSCLSPDLAPSDFQLFGPLKRHLGGLAFETEDDLISELRNWFDNLDVDFFRVGINSLLSRWQKCIDLHGD